MAKTAKVTFIIFDRNQPMTQPSAGKKEDSGLPQRGIHYSQNNNYNGKPQMFGKTLPTLLWLWEG